MWACCQDNSPILFNYSDLFEDFSQLGMIWLSRASCRTVGDILYDNVFKLLLLMSRKNLTGDQMTQARMLANTITDWQEFAETAQSKMVAGLVYENLRLIGGIDEAALNFMKRYALLTTIGAFKMQSALERFHNICIEPADITHVYFKGPLLADRYYSHPAHRPARDIDVLVKSESLEHVITVAFEGGYKALVDETCSPERLDQQSLKALLRYREVVSLISPKGFNIDVHRSIDKNSGMFDPTTILSKSETYNLNGRDYSVLPTAILLNYVCYHNTRHTWSRLHWIADLDWIIMSKDYNRDATLEYADEQGIRPMTEACLRMNALASSPDELETVAADDPGIAMLDLCWHNMEGNIAVERALRASYGLLGLPSDDLVSAQRRRIIKWRHFIALFRPRFVEYQDWPLHERWQILYFWTRFWDRLKRSLFDGLNS